MTSNWLKIGVAAAMLLAFVGCAAAPGAEAQLTAEESADEIRVASWEQIVGAWESDEGHLLNVVFTTDAVGATSHRYFGSRQVFCVRAPCLPVREEGSYRVTSRNVYLTTDAGTESFTYTLRGDSLTLRHGHTVAHRWHRVATYCATAGDCASQSYPTPRCVGYRTCEANRCGYRCGTAPATCATNADCGARQYCAAATCGGAGTCTARPDACIQLYRPACGCDGHTYGNGCMAASAGARVAHDGECAPAPGSCDERSDCPDGQFCRKDTCDGPGTCEAIAVRCDPSVEAPVCGCDGVTYRNWCLAFTAGQNLASEGACRRLAGLGEFCGGIAAFQCQPSLRCQLDGSFPDAGGHCVR